MPSHEELELEARKRQAGASPAAEPASAPTSEDRAAIAARNHDQTNALVGGHAEHEAPEAEEENWWDAPAPRVDASAPAPIVGPTRHRRGAPLLDGPKLTAEPTHRRAEPLLDGPQIAAAPGHRRGQAPMLDAPKGIPTHRRGQEPLLAAPSLADDSAAQQMALKRAQQGARIGPAVAASGFGGHGGGDRAKPTVARELTGATKDNDMMRRVALKQRQGVKSELAELGDGRAPLYRGKDDESADARAIVEDPRFAKNYAIDRETDHGGAVGRAVGEKREALSDFMGSKDKGAQAGKYAARTAARAVPFVGSGLAFGGGYKEHPRAAVDDGVAHDESADPLTRATATGLAGSHRKMRNKEVISGTVGLAKDIVNVSTGGLSAMIPSMPGTGDAAAHVGGGIVDRMTSKGAHLAETGAHKLAEQMTPDKLAEKAAWKAGKLGGTGVNKGVDWWEGNKSAHELRPGAVAPKGGGRRDLVEAGTDHANEELLRLAAGDGKFGAKMLDHLNADMPALDTNQHVLDAARSADPRSAKKGEHNLKPSQVARLVQGEGARGRQKERMGGTLDTLTGNENSRSWWEKSAGTDLKNKSKPAAVEAHAPDGEAHSKEEDEEEG